MNKLVFGGATFAIGLSAAAQDFVGFSYNAAVGATSRGTIGASAGEVMTRIDGSECAGWGTALPGFRTIRSIACVIQDQNAATPESFGIKLYPEDPARPGYPDLTLGVTFLSGVPGPTGTGGMAELRVATPAANGIPK